MVKLTKLFTALAAVALSVGAHAANYVGYKQDASSVEASNWKNLSGNPITLENDAVVLNTGTPTGPRGLLNRWGADAWQKADALVSGNDYYISFDFNLTAGNQQNSWGLWLTSANIWNVNTWTKGDDYLFAMVNDAASSRKTPKFTINGGSEVYTINSEKFYSLNLAINTEARSYTYSLVCEDGTTIATGERTDVPSSISMLPEGVFISGGKSYFTVKSKKLEVGKVSTDVTAIDPTYSVTGVQGASRLVAFDYQEGETLHITADAGVAQTLSGEELTSATFTSAQMAEAKIVVTKAGNIQAWTEIGGKKSQVVDVVVETGAITLPAPTFAMTNLEEGFVKTYQVKCDNSGIITKPEITILCTIDGVTSPLDASGLITLGQGGCQLKATANGFTDSEVVTIQNNQEFYASKVLDFEHMTAEQITALGFEPIADLHSTSTSGENQWTSRIYLYDDVMTDETTGFRYYGPDYVKKRAAVFAADGRVSLEANNGSEVPTIQRFEHPTLLNEMTQTEALDMFAPLCIPNKDNGANKAVKIQFKLGIGLCINALDLRNPTYTFSGLQDDEVAIVYNLSNYGSNAAHGRFASIEEAKASNHGGLKCIVEPNGSFVIAGINEALSRIVIMKAGHKAPTAVKEVEAADANAPIFNLRGQKVGKNNLTPGAYIQNGKLFLVK